MGQQTLVLSILISFFVSGAILGFVSNWEASSGTIGSQFENEQALNVATSGVTLALSKLRTVKTWRSGFNNLAVSNGRCTLTVSDIGKDSVLITSNGSYGLATHRSIVRAKLFSVFPVVESALTVYGDSVNLTTAGKSFSIDGRDYMEDGSTLGTHDPVYGVGVREQHSVNSVKAKAATEGVTDNINGKDGPPSVGLFTNGEVFDSLHAMYRSLATIRMSSGKYSGNTVLGTMSQPEIVYVPGNLEWTGNIAGCGILVIDGDLVMKGTITWKGIVIAMSADIDLYLGGSGTPNLLGTTFIGTNVPGHITNVKLNGNPYIRYSYDVLQNVLAKLNLLQVEVLSWYE
jgi:hypothetical protein